MKILLSENQYVKLVMELQHHPDGHDIDQRKLRMGRLESGVKVVMDWTPREMRFDKKIKMNVSVTLGKPKSEIIGKYILKPDVSQLINQRLDNIYTYTFPKFKSYAVLVYSFDLGSNISLNDRILYNGQPEDDTTEKMVKEIMSKKNRELMSAELSLTGYEEIDKSRPGSELSDKYKANYMVLIIDRNVAKTVFLTSKKQWEDKTFYGDFGWSIDEYIGQHEVPKHATRVETKSGYTPQPNKSNVEDPSVKKSENDSDVKESPVFVSEDVNKTWVMEWINSVKE
jgi:hypothetical protein